jgi:hypothetical protein
MYLSFILEVKMFVYCKFRSCKHVVNDIKLSDVEHNSGIRFGNLSN